MTRTLVMGDPQAPFAKVLEVLDRHGALAGDRLAPDVVLVSIGDHFDYDLRDPVSAGREGLAILRWLASHDAAQVRLLLGNHDASRVMELGVVDDVTFERARMLARQLDELRSEKGSTRSERASNMLGRTAEDATRLYEREFPSLPPSGVIGRDYAAFSSEQRTLVMELLLAGRFHLATTGELPDGRSVLLTHAGVTRRELAILGLTDDASPELIAAALTTQLAIALDRVRTDWQRGELTPLSLAPLHVSGSAGEEGGGLLYHRPSNPDRADADPAWAFAPSRPRRFDPRTLPRALTQVIGHSGHAKCVYELDGWVTDAARARKHGGIRTLSVTGDDVVYDLGIAPPAPGAAQLIMIDGELRRVDARDVALLPLARLDP
jgi:hypothetical protein